MLSYITSMEFQIKTNLSFFLRITVHCLFLKEIQAFRFMIRTQVRCNARIKLFYVTVMPMCALQSLVYNFGFIKLVHKIEK